MYFEDNLFYNKVWGMVQTSDNCASMSLLDVPSTRTGAAASWTSGWPSWRSPAGSRAGPGGDTPARSHIYSNFTISTISIQYLRNIYTNLG